MGNLFIWMVVIGAVFGPLVYLASTYWNIFQLWRVPTTNIGSMPNQGQVQVVGRIRCEESKSRLNNAECAFWQLEVKERQGSGKGGARWASVHKESSGPFEIDDITGRIMVKSAEKAEMVMKDEFAQEKLDDAILEKLESLGIKTKGLFGIHKKIRVYERLIMPGEEITVLGKFDKDTQEGNIAGGAITPVVISNLNKPDLLKTYFWRNTRPMLVPYLISLFSAAFFVYIMLNL
jgi:hypothetical protein